MSLTRRALVPVLAGALSVPALATGAAAAPGDDPVPMPRSITAACANPTSPAFGDVPATDAELVLAVRCLGTAGIALGVSGGGFAPGQPVSRGQMATFVARLLDAASAREAAEDAVQELPAATGAYPFPGDAQDGQDNATHRGNVQRLAQAGIASGTSTGRFTPNAAVTRAQMATFLNRAVAFAAGDDPADAGTTAGFAAPGAEYYVDPIPAVHLDNVNGVTSVGIAAGVGTQRFGADRPVTRGQMARFLTRTLSALFSTAGNLRVLGLLDVFSASFPDASRAQASRVAGAPGALGQRDLVLEGLDDAVEYRITLVRGSQVTVGDQDNLVSFAVGAPAANGSPHSLVATGMPTSTITSVNGAAPRNNGGVGTPDSADPVTASAVARPVGGRITVTIRGGEEAVLAAFYVNGRGAQASYATGGGLDHRLEVDSQGRPVERFGISGVTAFAAAP